MLDAYAVKKAAPKILIAVILINLSYYIALAAIDITNVIAEGLRYLITAPFNDAKIMDLEIKTNVTNSVTGVFGLGVFGALAYGAFAAPGVAGGIALAGLFFMAVFGITIPLIAIAILLTLIVRQGLIIFLTIIAPIAIACSILPGTEKYFKSYLDLFLKALIVYPIITSIFAISNVLGAILFNASNQDSTNGATGLLQIIVAMVVLFTPLFLIPFAFKFAGGALARIYQVGSTGSARVGSFIKGDPRDPNSLQSRAKRGALENLNAGRLRAANARYRDGSSRTRRFVGRAAQIGMKPADLIESTQNAAENERLKMLQATGNDRMAFAAAGYKLGAGELNWDEELRDGKLFKRGAAVMIGDRQATAEDINRTRYMSSKGDEITKALFDDSKRFMGGTRMKQNIFGYQLGKVAETDDLKQLEFAFSKSAQADGLNQDEVSGAWATVAYPGKGRFASAWYQSPQVQSDGSVSFIGSNPSEYSDEKRQKKAFSNMSNMVKDVHKTRQSYDYSRISGQDWSNFEQFQRMVEAKHATAPESVTDDEWAQYAMISDVAQGASASYAPQSPTGDDGGDERVVAQGAGAYAAKQIEALRGNQKFVIATGRKADGTLDGDSRIIADKETGTGVRQVDISGRAKETR